MSNCSGLFFIRSFSSCLLASLAWSELYVCIGVLFRPGGHKMRLAGTDESDMVPIFDSDVGVPKRNSRGLNVCFD